MQDENPWAPPASDITKQVLPATSQAGFLAGCWFVFPTEAGCIRVWGSWLSGKERIYVDERVVTERRNLRFSSEHAFLAGGQEHVVSIAVLSILKGHLSCTLRRNGTITQVLKVSMIGDLKVSWFRNIGVLLIAVAAGTTAALFEVPMWMTLASVGVFIFVFLKPAKDTLFVIEDITPRPQ